MSQQDRLAPARRRFFLWRILEQIPLRNPATPRLPFEILDYIISLAESDDAMTDENNRLHAVSPLLPSVAPASGAAPLLSLPNELRRKIFAESLPGREVIHFPSCKDDSFARLSSKNDPEKKPRHNRASDLMVLNKQISSEITEVLYQERFFAIHVHEGLRHGGIEFLDVGRQPLQYKDTLDDRRFYKFGKDDEFGFNRLKKIIVQIHPADEDHDRHTSMNTYFMNDALCRLLERSNDRGTRIVSLKIEFAKRKEKDVSGRNNILRAEHYWWDPNGEKPRETSTHGISNIQLVLLPFLKLTGCHSVTIELPQYVRNHLPTAEFVSELEQSMMSKHGTLFMNGDFEHKVEVLRWEHESYVVKKLHGKNGYDVPKLTEAEMMEDDGGDDGDDDDFKYKKHSLSPASGARGGDLKRQSSRKAAKDDTIVFHDSDADEQEAILELTGEGRGMDSGLQAAIAASLGVETGIQMSKKRIDDKLDETWYITSPRNVPITRSQPSRYNPAGPTSKPPTVSSSSFTGAGRRLGGAAGDQQTTSSVHSSVLESVSQRKNWSLPPITHLQSVRSMPETGINSSSQYFPGSASPLERSLYGASPNAAMPGQPTGDRIESQSESEPRRTRNQAQNTSTDVQSTTNVTSTATPETMHGFHGPGSAICSPSESSPTGFSVPHRLSNVNAGLRSILRDSSLRSTAPAFERTDSGVGVIDLTDEENGSGSTSALGGGAIQSNENAQRSSSSNAIRHRRIDDMLMEDANGDARQLSGPNEDKAWTDLKRRLMEEKKSLS